MSAIQFLRLWESYHQKLKPSLQEKLLSHELLPLILNFDKSQIMEVLPIQPKLASMFEALQQQHGSGVSVSGSNEIVQDPEHYEQPCVHGELSKNLCSICETSPDANRRTVFVTSGGMRYHYVFTCRALEAGQSAIENRGGARSQVQSTYEDLVKYSREPCSVCVI